MLKEARLKVPEADFFSGFAENMPFENKTFDGATSMFTIHHWQNMCLGLSEVCRVLKPGSNLVLLSFTPTQMKGYWLNAYFPEMMLKSMNLVPELDGMEAILNQSGFDLINTENYFVKDDLKDQFLYSGKHHPERYLVAEIRNNVSSFSAFSNEEEVNGGLITLEKDKKTGKIKSIIADYENDKGDYLFLQARKR